MGSWPIIYIVWQQWYNRMDTKRLETNPKYSPKKNFPPYAMQKVDFFRENYLKKPSRGGTVVFLISTSTSWA